MSVKVWTRFVRDSVLRQKHEYGQVHGMSVWMRFVRDSKDSRDKYID